MTEAIDASSLAKITDGYTPGHMVQAIQQILTERRIQQVCEIVCDFALCPVILVSYSATVWSCHATPPPFSPPTGERALRDQTVPAKALTVFALTETYTLYISMVRIINVFFFFCNVAFKKTVVSCGVCGAFGSN